MVAKILLLDIETAPAKAYVWGIYDQNIGHKQIIEDTYMLCWTAKWYGDRDIKFDSLINYPTLFKKQPRNDSLICKSIWKLMNEADIIVAHYGDQFDLKKLNAFFLKNNMPPVSSYKSIDTKKALSKHFGFISNKLDAICKELSLGQKVEHEGFDLWIKCMKGDSSAWKRMKKYNIGDVKLLEMLYNKIKPFMSGHPNMILYEENRVLRCKKCLSINFKRNGYAYTSTGKYQRYACNVCRSEFRDTINLLRSERISR
jgi:hypothetical protein